MTQTKANSHTSDATAMGNGNKKSSHHAFATDDFAKHSSKFHHHKDVAKWTSDEVQQWIKGQCKKFELKKATAEKFEMNGRNVLIVHFDRLFA